ncbi:MAG: D-alanyl-D-alanine carboxypeptidase family protein [Ruminococcaceae bacterium]|nr:D-alanyl-D-alanine carboxypeptidase family protein [Oscillospiraceae bacterium]
MKRIISIFLMIIMCFYSFSISVCAETENETYEYDTTFLASLKLCLAGITERKAEYDLNSDEIITTLDLCLLKLILSSCDTMIPELKSTSKGYLIEEKDGITYIEGILVVNKTYDIPSDYAPKGLTSECQSAFNEMKKAAKEDGISIWVSSGYRSFSVQKFLYEKYCKADGVLVADTYSARPGHSEHQTGLSIDVNSASSKEYKTTYKKVGEWLRENCWDYGFIIRYPEGKEEITGYIHEPWHVRYVGKANAKKIKDSGLCLEEYLGIDSKYAY